MCNQQLCRKDDGVGLKSSVHVLSDLSSARANFLSKQFFGSPGVRIGRHPGPTRISNVRKPASPVLVAR